jgi:hypothetical protein
LVRRSRWAWPEGNLPEACLVEPELMNVRAKPNERLKMTSVANSIWAML